MGASVGAIARVRYWIVVALRIDALALFVYAAVLLWRIVSRTLFYELFARGMGGNHLSPVYLLFEVALGPALVAAMGVACVRLGPGAARWLVPMPRGGCPECGYPAAAGSARCPECGAPLA